MIKRFMRWLGYVYVPEMKCYMKATEAEEARQVINEYKARTAGRAVERAAEVNRRNTEYNRAHRH